MAKLKQRGVGDKTRCAIISAARELFPLHGFSGTSLTAIATKAKINKSLILHHFKTKENLWKLVKASFFETIPDFEVLPEHNNIKDFVTTLITQRFMLYDKNPDMARMINHQRLESNSADLEGVGIVCFSQFIKVIQDFQSGGQVRGDLDAEFISLWMAVSSSGIFLIKEKPFKNKKQKQMYQDMIIESVLNTILVK